MIIATEGGQGAHTHEQVVGVRHIATHSKEFHQIMELAMYVAAYLLHVSAFRSGKTSGPRLAYCDRRADCDDISFFYQ